MASALREGFEILVEMKKVVEDHKKSIPVLKSKNDQLFEDAKSELERSLKLINQNSGNGDEENVKYWLADELADRNKDLLNSKIT